MWRSEVEDPCVSDRSTNLTGDSQKTKLISNDKSLVRCER